jgi:hypothetical protein
MSLLLKCYEAGPEKCLKEIHDEYNKWQSKLVGLWSMSIIWDSENQNSEHSRNSIGFCPQVWGEEG